MYLRITKSPKGVEYAHTVEGWRDERGKARQRIVASHGKVSDLLAADPGALDKLRTQAAAMTTERAARRGRVDFDTAAPSDVIAPLNVGWGLADAVLDRLGVTALLEREARAGGWRVDVAGVLRLLVAQRLVDPCSKLASWEHRERLAGGPEVELGHVYQGLDRIAALAGPIQQAASAGVGRTPGSLASVDYDVTNYFFHIDAPDDGPDGKTVARGRASRQRGHSKESRPDPIIQLGLFLDEQGLPVSYRLFDQNTPDTSTLPAALDDFKTMFGHPRVVVVADKAMNTNPNLGCLLQQGDGWIVSASARHTDAKMREWILDGDGWTDLSGGARVKSMTTTRVVKVTEFGVENLPKKTPEKIVARWSPESATRDAHTRQEMLTRAQALIEDPARYKAASNRGPRHYIDAATINTVTGEVLADTLVLTLDHAQAEADALMDGYQLIRTSETHLADRAILERYHQLWRIEQTFRLSKTDLKTRPVYVRTRAHIEAHFAICFLALLIARLLQQHTGLDAARLVHALRGLQAVPVGANLYKTIRPTSWDQIDAALGVTTDQAWATLPELRAWRRAWTTTSRAHKYTTPQPA